MHIEEGFLPPLQCAAWAAVAAIPVALGLRAVESVARERPSERIRLGIAAGLVFCLSSIELPTVAGAEGHATGLGIALALAGPVALAPALLCVLVLQALLLGHGGLTTLGANVMSLAVVGAWCGHLTDRVLGARPRSARFRAFGRAVAANAGAYAVAASALALAAPGGAEEIPRRLVEYAGLISLTQAPLALAEGLVTQFVVSRMGQGSEARPALRSAPGEEDDAVTGSDFMGSVAPAAGKPDAGLPPEGRDV